MIVVPLPPGQPGLDQIFAESDDFMASLYPAESYRLMGLGALADSAVTLVGILSGDEVTACGALVRGRDGCAELKRMFVRERARGLGFGRAVLGGLLGIADSEKLTVRLETGVRQRAAIALYLSNGFEEIAAFPPHIPDPLSVFMERRRRGR